MKEFGSIDIRPYQMLCLICRQSRQDRDKPYYHEARLNEIQTAIQTDPTIPLTLRCNTDTIFRYQNPGRDYDTPEGEMYNDLRDLTILQRINAVPGTTLPAIDFFSRIPEAIPTCRKICGYPKTETPLWPRCRLADSKNYERGIKMGIDSFVSCRLSKNKQQLKNITYDACLQVKSFKIRPHQLLCMICSLRNSYSQCDHFTSIQADNFFGILVALNRNPDTQLKLVREHCIACPSCSACHAPSNRSLGENCMGLRDNRTDLEVLRHLALRYGDTISWSDFDKIYSRVVFESPEDICGYDDDEVYFHAYFGSRAHIDRAKIREQHRNTRRKAVVSKFYGLSITGSKKSPNHISPGDISQP